MTPALPPPPFRRRSFLRGLGHGLNVTRLVILNLVFFAFLCLLLLLVVVASFAGRHAVQPQSVLVLKPQG
ncbi:MAG: signal peptide peptidase SppA, partial [Rhodanobacter sp.]